jgi:hypothetical protein
VTGRDSEEPDRPPDTDVDAAFAEIVAGWEREYGHTEWPASESVVEPVVEPAVEPEPDEAQVSSPAEEDDVTEDEGHFVPPEPPPLPRPQPQTIGAVALFLFGVVLLAVPSLLDFSSDASLVLGLLAMSGSIAWLIARLRQGPPTDSGWDDGAQL